LAWHRNPASWNKQSYERFAITLRASSARRMSCSCLVNDVVSACASNKPTNALPSFAAARKLPQLRWPPRWKCFQDLWLYRCRRGRGRPSKRNLPTYWQSCSRAASCAATAGASQPVPKAIKAAPPPPPPVVEEPEAPELGTDAEPEPLELMEPTAAALAEPELDGDFNVDRLSAEEQELHRRANRVAKVSMQDIKMLRPEQVRLGRQNKDLCNRLKDDIEKGSSRIRPPF